MPTITPAVRSSVCFSGAVVDSGTAGVVVGVYAPGMMGSVSVDREGCNLN